MIKVVRGCWVVGSPFIHCLATALRYTSCIVNESWVYVEWDVFTRGYGLQDYLCFTVKKSNICLSVELQAVSGRAVFVLTAKCWTPLSVTVCVCCSRNKWSGMTWTNVYNIMVLNRCFLQIPLRIRVLQVRIKVRDFIKGHVLRWPKVNNRIRLKTVTTIHGNKNQNWRRLRTECIKLKWLNNIVTVSNVNRFNLHATLNEKNDFNGLFVVYLFINSTLSFKQKCLALRGLSVWFDE